MATGVQAADGSARVTLTNGAGSEVSLGNLDIPLHDYISVTYTSGNPTTVVYKTGGSGGTTVATLTITYDASNNPLTVTKS